MKFSSFTLTSWILLGLASIHVLAAPISDSDERSFGLDNSTIHNDSLSDDTHYWYERELAEALAVMPIDRRAVDPNNPMGLVYSANSKDWPTDAELDKALASGKDKAWFWTGRVKDVNGISVIGTALEQAQKTGGTTLELAIKKAGLKMPDPINRPPRGKTTNEKGEEVTISPRWSAAADAFAKHALGTVHVVRGESTRTGNTWDRLEFPRLKKMGKVTKIIQVSPMSLKTEKVIWPETKAVSSSATHPSATKAPAKVTKAAATTKAKATPKTTKKTGKS